MSADFDAHALLEIDPIPPTDFGAFVTEVLAQHQQSGDGGQKIDQKVLRQCIDLAPSFLLTDTAMTPASGADTWFTGLGRLVDLVVILHKRGELELETVNSASRACSECWTIAGTWRQLEECRVSVRNIGSRLKTILDPNERTYQGQRVYAP
ncbi:unnamed protein product [Cyclocybe aegerita]|uniref:Uncharacterized protein n=1 Tax=Cyclocybe aegerita TaxID=1973307 RepID=A0A8S0VQF3_CYCAE|nr:unnamed protein product [Cyclocybe aegerita]